MSQTPLPLASIVVRTKDRPLLLKRALHSIASSSYRALQVVIVNDGGAPVSGDEVSAIFGTIPFKLINLPENLGRPSSLNLGILESEGQYVCFLDDDDVLLPAGIESLIKAAMSNPDTVIYGDVICKLYSASGDDLKSHWIMGDDFDRERLLLENFIPLNALCIPRHLLSQIGEIDKTFHIYEDWDMLIRLSEVAKFLHINATIAEYNIYNESTLTGKGGEEFQRQYRERLLQKHLSKITPAIIMKFIFQAPHIKAKDDLIAHYIREKQSDLEEIKFLKRQHDALIAKLNSQSVVMKENIALENKVRTQSEIIKQQKEETSKLLSQLNTTQRDYNDLLNSNSWRLTRPLRELKALFRGKKNKKDCFDEPELVLDYRTHISEALPKVEVIIVNYNGIKYIENCLSSLLKTDYPVFSITVVDNGSTDGSLQIIEDRYPSVKVIKNNENLGFGIANDIAIQATEAQYIALLNNDTLVTSNWLQPLVKALLFNRDVAAASSKLLFIDKPNVINNAGGGMSLAGFGYDRGIHHPDGEVFSRPSECLFPSGAACVIKKEAYLRVGGFDKSFFMYHEDVDLGWRLWLYGYRVLYIPQSVVYHAFGGTTKKVGGNTFKREYGLQHAIRSLIKNYETKNLLKSLAMMSSIGIKDLLFKGQGAFVKAMSWNLKNMNDTLRHRRDIKKNRTLSDDYLLKKALIFDGTYPPVYEPDYEITDLELFKKSDNRRGSILLGINDEGNLGYGWHTAETRQRVRFRFTMSEATVYLYAENSNKLIIEAALSQLIPANKTTIYINGEPFELNIKGDRFDQYTIAIDSLRGFVEIKIKVDQTFIPHEHYHNKDFRQIGIAVKKIEVVNTTIDNQDYNGISVIIPTYNRSSALMKTLTALNNQSLPKELYEVIVVDDGSTDDTAQIVREFMNHSAINCSYHFQENKKQGAARNLGIGFAKYPIILFIGDDTTPEHNLLAEHLQTHKDKNKDGKTAVLGFTDWPIEFKVTPFSRYVSGYGHQFGYDLIGDGDLLGFSLFYTSNISVARAFLCKQNPIFDEDFKTYGWEDIDLGYRLQKAGMTILYNKNAKTRHYHRMDIYSFTKRQLMVGRGAHIMLSKHPELWRVLKTDKIDYLSRYKTVASLTRHLIYLCDIAQIPLPHPVYRLVLDVYYAKGYRDEKGKFLYC